MQIVKSFVLVGSLMFAAHSGQAAILNGTGNVTPGIIFGTGGNANGAFTGETRNNIEVGLRGKQRYAPANVFNYDGDHTYTFDSTVLTTNPANRSVFNFEWSINVDQDGTSGSVLSDFEYAFSFDTDPGAATSFATIDPFNTPGWFDHSLGTNATPTDGGIESPDNATLLTNMGSYSVAQQSANLGFGFSADPDLPGIYSFSLSVLEKGTSVVLSSSAIDVRVEPVAPVPLPAVLPIMLLAVGGMGAAAMRRRKS